MQKGDLIRLQHMLDSCKETLEFLGDKPLDDLRSDRVLVLALLKAIEIIGEAASKVSSETRRLFPQIPWQDIVSMRNRLVHVYFDVDIRRVWETVKDDIPRLENQLQDIISKIQE